jgi:hypothetical protein
MPSLSLLRKKKAGLDETLLSMELAAVLATPADPVTPDHSSYNPSIRVIGGANRLANAIPAETRDPRGRHDTEPPRVTIPADPKSDLRGRDCRTRG